MIDRKVSVHLQDYPDVSYLEDEKNLVSDMDLVRNICSSALSIRDNKNLRVRLPLGSLRIIGINSSRILPEFLIRILTEFIRRNKNALEFFKVSAAFCFYDIITIWKVDKLHKK